MTKLKPFQLEGARAIYDFGGRALLADEMGLGKTIQALFWVHKIRRRRPVVIVTPAGLMWIWHAEAALHFGMRVEVLEGMMPTRQRTLPGPIVIVSYDTLPSWLPVLTAARPQCVIFDEVHYCKEKSTLRSKAALKLVRGAASVLGLSGTPLTNRPIELWNVLRLIRPDIFPDWTVYAWRYCKPRKTPWGWKYDGAEHLGELHRILREECMIRRLKSKVMTELPNKRRRVVVMKLAPEGLAEYRKAQDHFREWLHNQSPLRARRARKSMALVKVGYLLRLVARLKLELMVRWITRFRAVHPGGKLVALTMNTFVIDYLVKRFPTAVIVDGRIRGRKRTEAVRRFQSHRSTWLLIGNWRAAGVGNTMTAAQDIAALDYPWTPGDLLQGEDRIHRIGQKLEVTAHYLTARDTVEEKLVSMLQRKAEVLGSVLDGGEAFDPLNIYDELMKPENYL